MLLIDVAQNELHLKLRRDWDSFAAEEAEVLSQMEDQIRQCAKDMGATELLEQFEQQLSGLFRITDREPMSVGDFQARLRRLYREAVSETVAPFRTHLPLINAEAAAGRLSAGQLPETIGWVEAPDGLRLTEEMFVMKVKGRSMEPLIPDESLCIFRRGVAGSRQGRKLLIQRCDIDDPLTQLTVKSYRSGKKWEGEDEWEHTLIELIPENPEFESWQLSPDAFIVIAELVRVLPSEE